MIRHFDYRCKAEVVGSPVKVAKVYTPPSKAYTLAEVITRTPIIGDLHAVVS